MQLDFALAPAGAPTPSQPALNPDRHQWFTPLWAAQLLFDAHFSHLDRRDVVWEPAAGAGACLAAVPAHIRAFGTELDPRFVTVAARNSGRPVHQADFRSGPLPEVPTAIFSNPPFDLDLIDALIERAADLLPAGTPHRRPGRVGLLLPAYAVQTSRHVLRWNRAFSLLQEALPRDLFPGLSKPLVFVVFTRASAPVLVNFRLYAETAALHELPKHRQELLAHGHAGPRGVWRHLVTTVLKELGGSASTAAIYAAVEARRPTSNPWWREQIRKTLQLHCARVGPAVWTLA